MRAVVGMFVLAACGRLDFDPRGGQQITGSGSGSIAITAVSPTWLPAAGGAIAVTATGDVDGISISVDGAPCAAGADAVHCTAPAHAPAAVTVTATNAAGDTASWSSLAYLTPGMYQLGTTANDNTSGVAVDRDGNVFITGGTQGSLGAANLGDFDAFLVKYDVTGTIAWVRQLGTPLYDYSRDVAVDPAGNATITGYTAGDLGGTNAGSNDVFVARYAPDGTLMWVTQTGGAGDDQAWDVAVDDAGNTVVAVQTTGALGAGANAGGNDFAIIHYDGSGMADWVQQDGTASDDYGHSVAMTHDGFSYLVGYTTGSLATVNAGGLDMFVARYESNGTRDWLMQRGGAGDDSAQDVTIDPAGEAWISGSTTAALDGQSFGGGTDVFVMHFTAGGTWQLTRELGGAGSENSWGIGVGTDGTVYVECVTTAAFDGQAYIGGPEDFCMKSFDHTGVPRWTRIAGTAGTDQSSSCFVDNARTGLVYMSLITDGSLDGTANAGAMDIGVVKYDENGAIQ